MKMILLPKIIYFGALLIGVSSFMACDFLDVVPDDVPTLDHAFEDRAKAEKYLFTCYGHLPEAMNPAKDPAVMGSGEFLSYTTGNGAISLYNLGLITGGQNISNPICNNWQTDTWYTSPYDGIRVCNTFLEKIDEPFDMDLPTKKRWTAEAKFLKAYFNYLLIRMYGPIVIQDVNHDVNAAPEQVREYRSPLEECFEYVISLLDECEKDLPLHIEKETAELGRATKVIAKAVKAKVLVLAASPLFNGNPMYSEIADERGVKLFPPSGEDKKKWETAAKALYEAIELAESSGFELYHLKSHAYELNEELELQLTLRYKIWDAWNKETIWGYTKYDNFSLQSQAMPRLTADALKNPYVKGSALAPTQFVADLYYTENGVPMSEDKTFDYPGRMELRSAEESEKWKVSTAHDGATGVPFVTVKMNFNREPRFYANLGFDGALWWGNGKYDLLKYDELYRLSSKFSQLQGRTWGSLYSVTGYFAKKLVSPETTFNEYSFNVEPAPFPIIRLSDLYLLLAEAENELNGPCEAAFKYLDAVRAKAGIEDARHAWRKYSNLPAKTESQEGLREIIRRERMIELAMEGQTIWDLRRWLLGTKYWNGPTKTWNISEKMPEAYYRQIPVTTAHKKFSQRDYLWPISQAQLSVNPKLVQNYGW